MLVLSRKTGEEILIPGLSITLTVLNISPSRVRLGIKAPAHIDIRRPEARSTSETSDVVEQDYQTAYVDAFSDCASLEDYGCEFATS